MIQTMQYEILCNTQEVIFGPFDYEAEMLYQLKYCLARQKLYDTITIKLSPKRLNSHG